MPFFRVRSRVALVVAVAASVGCSSSNKSGAPVGSGLDAGSDGGPSLPGDGGSTLADANTTDAGATGLDGSLVFGTSSIEQWLALGVYKTWAAEPAVHASRSPSPHGFNRIYSNSLIAAGGGAAATGPWPVGAAAVKELYASATDTAPVGYAVYLKTADDTDAGGAAWYWYERVPLDSAVPHDDAGVVANGLGMRMTPANTICVGCHAAAGSDGAHTPSAGGHGEVYTPVSSATPDASADTPPTGGANVEAWLATGTYKTWASEPAVHASRSPSPHGFNRIYSNSIISLSEAAGGATGNWPVGAAAVKELFASAMDTVPVGYAVYLKTADDTDAGGAAWYWYERVPSDSTAPHDEAGVVADGLGTGTTPANTVCVGCHAAAGSDPAHSPSSGSQDEVYTPAP